MYIKYSKIKGKKQLELMKFFVSGTTARTIADLTSVNRNTATSFYHKLREKIAHQQSARQQKFYGEVELDESYFGGIRKGKKGRGARGKIPVFGILKRNGLVYTWGYRGYKDRYIDGHYS